MLKELCQKYTCPYSKYFATKNYIRTFEVFYYHTKFFVVSFTFIYTYMHIGEPISCHAHTCIYLKRNFHAIYLHLKGNSTSYIHFGEAFSCHIQHVYIHKVLDHLFNMYTFHLKGICLLLPVLYIHAHGEEHLYTN